MLVRSGASDSIAKCFRGSPSALKAFDQVRVVFALRLVGQGGGSISRRFREPFTDMDLHAHTLNSKYDP
jgi:hypothetical protein